MQIPCPHCGLRDSAEFTYIGDASLTRPSPDAPEADWCTYLYARRNPMGRHREYWQHTAGCRAVLIVVRDTLTHEIFETRLAGARDVITEAAPALEPAQ